MGEPAFIVPNICHPAVNFFEKPSGFLASSVIFKKMGETNLDWPVNLNDIIDTHYPGTKSPWETRLDMLSESLFLKKE